MKVFFDTSVLVATFYADHEHHAPSFKLFVEQTPKSAVVAAHSLAEVYAVVTGMPGKNRPTPDEALLFLENIRERFSMVELSAEQYVRALQASAASGIMGEGIYDALLAHAAVISKAAILYTWNVKHFSRFGPEIAHRVRTP